MDEDKSDPASFSDINNLFCKVCWNQEQLKQLYASAGWCIWIDHALASNETKWEGEEREEDMKMGEASFIQLLPIRLQALTLTDKYQSNFSSDFSALRYWHTQSCLPEMINPLHWCHIEHIRFYEGSKCPYSLWFPTPLKANHNVKQEHNCSCLELSLGLGLH